MGSNVSSPGGRDGALNNSTHMLRKPVKILLLGAGGSGKSTFLKQLRVLEGQPFSPHDIEMFRQLIFWNLTAGTRNLHNAVVDMGIALSEKVGSHLKATEHMHDLRDGEPFPEDLLGHLEALWEDSSLQEAWKQGNGTALSENLSYFFSSIDRLFCRSYVPSEQDIMRYSVRTTGISETKFDFYGYPVVVVDVGGQRSERRKWIHCFPDATCVIFSVNLNGYDQYLFESGDQNEMQEAMVLWDSICGSRWFTQCSIILFLNKFDLFEQKVLVSDIGAFFPDFQGPAKDVDAGYRYFKRRFAEIAKRSGRVHERTVHIFAVSTVDTSMLREMMTTIEDVVLRSNHSLDLV